MIRQYLKVKALNPEAILLFRVGDFYETYSTDALTASKVLGLVLTKRANGHGTYIEMAGFPHHALDSYLPKLVRAGYKVAVCDQLEDPRLAVKLVKRGITELVTPGVAYNDLLLKQKENNYLASAFFSKDKGGVAFLDISTGTFKVAEGSLDYVGMLIDSFAPKEVLLQKGYEKGFRERFTGEKFYISTIEEWAFVYETAYGKLCKQFGLASLKGFGVEGMTLALTAAGAIMSYLEITQHTGLGNICSISRIDQSKFVWMDRFTVRNLELFHSLAGEEGVSLLDVIDKCSSGMGSRRLREWISLPEKDIGELESRYDTVDYFLSNQDKLEETRNLIGEIGDLERISSKAAAGRILPREAVQLMRGLQRIEPIRKLCMASGSNSVSAIGSKLDDCAGLRDLLKGALLPDPAQAIGKGDVIAPGVDPQLDEYRNTVRHGTDILEKIRIREIGRTGINSLKISFNNVFGYYLEVRNTFKDKVPQDWIRKQTLVNAERYITPELKDYEEQIVTAQNNILDLEAKLYGKLVEKIQEKVPVILRNADAIARLDVLCGFAELATANRYCRPKLNEGDKLTIKQGRHPVIETMMPEGESYIANDLFLDNDSQQIIILTGPNMAGKSALLRQTALIVLLAQIGSFVPAESAEIGIVDKIFTRVGASDNISRGESTFMVEMTETATILHNLSEKSLVLLDEIGRGTSTYDGMSIAWAIVEYLHASPYRPKTLFATHYHELNELENRLPRVHNFHISAKEADGQVIFLRKLVPGGSEHSFGIHVAQLAGMPMEVVRIAEETLKGLESQQKDNVPDSGNSPKKDLSKVKELKEEGIQLSLYQLEDPLLTAVRDELRSLDLNSMSPLDAFDEIRKLQKETGIKKK
jgi:DNA mismatch repair protein MutS